MIYKETLQLSTEANSFSLNNECLHIEGNINDSITSDFLTLSSRLPAKLYKSFKSSIIRTSFYIELTNPTADTDSTKYQIRWAQVLKSDVRYAEYEQCVSICSKLVHKIAYMSDDDLVILKDYCSNSIYSYELPIDYINRHAVPFHATDNIDVFITEGIKKCTAVRSLIKDNSLNPKADIFQKIISSKIKVKAYQTDRAQTGMHQTNREKRWESHPDNFQFAFRRDCNAIEASLILQVCMFKDVDKTLVDMLKEHLLLPETFDYYKCPVTGDILHYDDFENEILNRVHGKSSFQVGHLSPLKSSGSHVSGNIGWISDDGNRIQGSLSMAEVNKLLIRIYINRPELRP